jgi:hypothetical protein
MASESGGSASASASSMEAAAQRAMSGFWGRLSTGEQVAFGGALVLLVIGDFVLGDLLQLGGVPFAMEIAAADVVLLIWAKAMRPGMSWPFPFPMLLAALAVIIAVPTFSDVLADVGQLGTLFGDAGRLGAWVIDTIAGLAVGLGAWMTWQAEAR